MGRESKRRANSGEEIGERGRRSPTDVIAWEGVVVDFNMEYTLLVARGKFESR